MILKKGQITVFVIIGIILIISLFLIFKLQNTETEGITETGVQKVIELDASSINLFVQECVNMIGADSIDIAGKQGGYTDLNENMLATFYGFFGYAYDEGTNKLLSKEEMSNQISLYVETFLPDCINDFSIFKSFDILQGNVKAETLIGANDVSIKVNYPLKISKLGSETTISDFISKYDVRLSHIYDIVDKTANRMILDEGWIDVTYMSDFDIQYEIYPHNETILIFSITDDKSILNNKPYQFLFANRLIEDENE
ncbi:hypothetical protein CL615_04470 [archaeon]|jgi:hypothetical protein|nr:hypothetical protein [archaeon]|tara:strand:- start:2896 stop:3663 length:768 start_codon:yes stop_codon:yes gene_type:complete